MGRIEIIRIIRGLFIKLRYKWESTANTTILIIIVIVGFATSINPTQLGLVGEKQI